MEEQFSDVNSILEDEKRVREKLKEDMALKIGELQKENGELENIISQYKQSSLNSIS